MPATLTRHNAHLAIPAVCEPVAASTECSHLSLRRQRIALCTVCHADVLVLVDAGEITWTSLHEMGFEGIASKMKYLRELDAELKRSTKQHTEAPLDHP